MIAVAVDVADPRRAPGPLLSPTAWAQVLMPRAVHATANLIAVSEWGSGPHRVSVFDASSYALVR